MPSGTGTAELGATSLGCRFVGAALCACKSRRTDGYQWVPEPKIVPFLDFVVWLRERVILVDLADRKRATGNLRLSSLETAGDKSLRLRTIQENECDFLSEHGRV